MGWKKDNGNGRYAKTAGDFAQAQGDFAKVQGETAQGVAEQNATKFLSPVDTVALRDSTYPNPQNGDTVRVLSTATMYRFQTGTGWVVTDKYEPTAIDAVNQQLAEKVGGQRKLKPEEFSDEAMALVTGNGTVNVLSVPQDASVTIAKTNFLKNTGRGTNSMETVTIRTGGYYDNTGVWTVSAGFYSITDYINVTKDVEYENNFYSFRGYDINGNLTITSTNDKAVIKVTDSVTVKIRPNFKTEIPISTASVKEILYNFERLGIVTKNVQNENITTEKIKEKAVTRTRLSDSVATFFPQTFETNKWFYGYIASNGVPTTSNNNLYTSDYFYFKKDSKITVSDTNVDFRTALYTLSNGVYTFVSRTSIMSEYTVPADGYYRLQMQKKDLTEITDIPNIVNKITMKTIDVVAKNKDVESLTTQVNSLTSSSNSKETPNPLEKFMHFSIDDVITPFQDLNTNAATYTSIFDSVFFSKLKAKHDLYGMVISLYCFYENNDASFNLSMMTNKFKKEFMENSHWLRFGFHAKNINSDYSVLDSPTALTHYNDFITQILRITGSYKCIDRVTRLHYYAGNLQTIRNFKNAKGGIVGLLTAEDNRINYYHTQVQTNRLLSYDRLYDASENLLFFSTDIRSDNDSAPYNTITARKNDVAMKDRMNDIILFFHDTSYLYLTGIDGKIGQYCDFAVENGYRFAFPMDVVTR